jgi:Lysozyme like domain
VTVLTAEKIAMLVLPAWGGDQGGAAIMTAIILAESGGNSDATHTNSNGSTDTGLAQINSVHGYTVEQLKDPGFNVKAARLVYDKQGWPAWTMYRNGQWKTKHSTAIKAVQLASGGGGGGGLLDGIPIIGDVPGLDAVTNGAADAATSAIGDALSAAGLDDLPRKVVVIGTGMILLWFGGALVALGAWRLSTASARKVVQTTSTATGAAGIVGALM